MNPRNDWLFPQAVTYLALDQICSFGFRELGIQIHPCQILSHYSGDSTQQYIYVKSAYPRLYCSKTQVTGVLPWLWGKNHLISNKWYST